MVQKKSKQPLAFAVEVNGELLCTAGLRGKRGVFSVFLTSALLEEFPIPDSSLDVSGLNSVTGKHLDWLSGVLEPGDVVTMRIVENAKVSRVKSSKPHFDAIDRDKQLGSMRKSAKRLGYRLVKARPSKARSLEE